MTQRRIKSQVTSSKTVVMEFYDRGTVLKVDIFLYPPRATCLHCCALAGLPRALPSQHHPEDTASPAEEIDIARSGKTARELER